MTIGLTVYPEFRQHDTIIGIAKHLDRPVLDIQSRVLDLALWICQHSQDRSEAENYPVVLDAIETIVGWDGEPDALKNELFAANLLNKHPEYETATWNFAPIGFWHENFG